MEVNGHLHTPGERTSSSHWIGG